MSIKLLGLPYDLNSSFLRGPALAPARIRLMEREGSANTYAEDGTNIILGETYEDLGDLNLTGLNPAAAFHAIRKGVQEAISDGSKLVSLGGDHSVAYPVLDAYTERHPGLHVLQIDAHGDLYDDFEGNPYSHASPFARIMEEGKVGSLTQVGIRTFNTHQRQQADRYGVNVIEAKDFSLDFIKDLHAPLYISLDLDALDPAFAPGVSHHEPGGLSTREVIRLIQNIGTTIIGADIVEYNPTRDLHQMTAMVAYKLMKELMVRMIK